MSSNIIFSNIPQEILSILTPEQKVHLWDTLIAPMQQSDVPVTAATEDKPQMKSKKGYSKNIPIYEMKKFEIYSRPRYYNEKTGMWHVKHTKKSKPMYLPFHALVMIIQDYQKGIPVLETHKKLQLHDTKEGVRNAQCIYRGGALMMESMNMPENMVINLKTLFPMNAMSIGGDINELQ